MKRIPVLLSTLIAACLFCGCLSSGAVPQSPTVLPVKAPVVIAGQYVEMAEGENWGCALAFDGRFAYVGCNIDPDKGKAIIARVDTVEMKRTTSLRLSKGVETRVHALTNIDGYLVHGSFSNPAVFTMIDPASLSEASAYQSPEEGPGVNNDKQVRSIIQVGEYVYAACDTGPGKIVKLRMNTTTKRLERISALTLRKGEDRLHCLTTDGTYIYAGCRTTPGKIVKVDPRTMRVVTTLVLQDDESNVTSMCYGDGYIYAGLFAEPDAAESAVPVRVVKVDPATMQRVSYFTGRQTEVGTRAMLYHEGFLYLGCWTAPGKVIVLDPADFTRKMTIDLTYCRKAGTDAVSACNFTSSLIPDGKDLLASCDMSPARLVRITGALVR